MNETKQFRKQLAKGVREIPASYLCVGKWHTSNPRQVRELILKLRKPKGC